MINCKCLSELFERSNRSKTGRNTSSRPISYVYLCNMHNYIALILCIITVLKKFPICYCNFHYRVSLLTGCSSCQMKLRIQNLLLSLQNFIRQKLLLHVIEAETFDGRSETFAGNALLPIQENRLFNHV